MAKFVREAVRACRLIYVKMYCRQWNYHYKILCRHFKGILSILCTQCTTCLIHIKELPVCTFEKPFTTAWDIENNKNRKAVFCHPDIVFSQHAGGNDPARRVWSHDLCNTMVFLGKHFIWKQISKLIL